MTELLASSLVTTRRIMSMVAPMGALNAVYALQAWVPSSQWLRFFGRECSASAPAPRGAG